uniref:Uncharacterized protein n=1 Tax=Anguilla anguilla TaxID=7936 RepID=A0A0E9TF98_ANGAN
MEEVIQGKQSNEHKIASEDE